MNCSDSEFGGSHDGRIEHGLGLWQIASSHSDLRVADARSQDAHHVASAVSDRTGGCVCLLSLVKVAHHALTETAYCMCAITAVSLSWTGCACEITVS